MPSATTFAFLSNWGAYATAYTIGKECLNWAPKPDSTEAVFGFLLDAFVAGLVVLAAGGLLAEMNPGDIASIGYLVVAGQVYVYTLAIFMARFIHFALIMEGEYR